MQVRRNWTHKTENPQKQTHQAQILLNQYKSLVLERQSSPLKNLKIQAIQDFSSQNKIKVIKCQPKKNIINNPTMLLSIKLKGQKQSDLLLQSAKKSQNFIFLRKNSSLRILNHRKMNRQQRETQIKRQKSLIRASSVQLIRKPLSESKNRHKTSRAIKKSQQNQFFLTSVDLKVAGRKAPFAETIDILRCKIKSINKNNDKLIRCNTFRISQFQNYY